MSESDLNRALRYAKADNAWAGGVLEKEIMRLTGAIARLTASKRPERVSVLAVDRSWSTPDPTKATSPATQEADA